MFQISNIIVTQVVGVYIYLCLNSMQIIGKQLTHMQATHMQACKEYFVIHKIINSLSCSMEHWEGMHCSAFPPTLYMHSRYLAEVGSTLYCRSGEDCMHTLNIIQDVLLLCVRENG